MRIPVLLVAPVTPHLRESATEAMTNMAAGMDISAAPTYPGIELDARFAPVPLGSATPGDFAIEMAAPQASEVFVLRGHTAVEPGGAPPTTAGDAIVFSDPQIATLAAPTCGGSAPVGDAAKVAHLLNVSKLQQKHLTGAEVAIAIVDTGINIPYLTTKLGHAPGFDLAASWQPPGTPPPNPGAWPVNHGTMCAFDVLIAASAATLVDFPVLSAHFPGGGSVMSGTLSAAVAAYGFMLNSWSTGRLKGYRALVASNSWGIFHPSWDFPPGHPGRYCDNPNHPFNIQMGTITRAGIDVIFAAGNCGAPCADGRCRGRTQGVIMGASAMPEVLTIAGCDTNNHRVGYSSQGPSIAGMYQDKPDVTSYTHFLGSEAFGPGSPDSGTSAACPVAAGCVAALRTSTKIPSRTTFPPAKLFTALRNSAVSTTGGHAWNADYGFGIIDPIKAATLLGI